MENKKSSNLKPVILFLAIVVLGLLASGITALIVYVSPFTFLEVLPWSLSFLLFMIFLNKMNELVEHMLKKNSK